MTPTIRETSTSTTFAPPPAKVSFQNNMDLLAPHSCSPEILSSMSPEAVLGNFLPTGTPLITCPTESDHPSYQESHSSIIAGTSPGAFPLLTSTPELVPTISDEGRPKTSSREDKDALDLPPVDRASEANTMATDVFPQLPPLLPANDVVVEGSSQQEFDAEQTGDSPLNISHGQLDTV